MLELVAALRSGGSVEFPTWTWRRGTMYRRDFATLCVLAVFSAWLGSVWLGDFTNQRTWREASNKSILRHFSSISCSHCGSLDQVSFNVAKCPFKTFFAVARIPSPVIDIRLHDHNITTGWSQKRGPFCSENRVLLMQIVSTRSGCPFPWLHSGASQILRNSRFSASELRKISWPSTVFWLRQEAPWWRPANPSRRRRMHWDLGQNAGILGGMTA